MLYSQPDWPKTLDEFRAWHERQPEVWEFIYGVPKLMAPGSKAHTLIKSNAGRLLGNALERTGCRVLIDGAIVEVHGSSLIPGLVVTCAPLDFSTARVDEPLIIVEILSPSNEKDDIGRKLALYLEIPSLIHYLVIHQDRRQVVHHERRDDLGGAFLTNIAPARPFALGPARHRDLAGRALRGRTARRRRVGRAGSRIVRVAALEHPAQVGEPFQR